MSPMSEHSLKLPQQLQILYELLVHHAIMAFHTLKVKHNTLFCKLQTALIKIFIYTANKKEDYILVKKMYLGLHLAKIRMETRNPLHY